MMHCKFQHSHQPYSRMIGDQPCRMPSKSAAEPAYPPLRVPSAAAASVSRRESSAVVAAPGATAPSAHSAAASDCCRATLAC